MKKIVAATIMVLACATLAFTQEGYEELYEFDGYKGIKWGMHFNKIQNNDAFMPIKQTNDKKVISYVKENDTPIVFGIVYRTVEYLFYEGVFVAVVFTSREIGDNYTTKEIAHDWVHIIRHYESNFGRPFIHNPKAYNNFKVDGVGVSEAPYIWENPPHKAKITALKAPGNKSIMVMHEQRINKAYESRLNKSLETGFNKPDPRERF